MKSEMKFPYAIPFGLSEIFNFLDSAYTQYPELISFNYYYCYYYCNYYYYINTFVKGKNVKREDNRTCNRTFSSEFLHFRKN